MVAARLGFEKAMVDPDPTPRLTAWTGLENTTLTLQGLVSGKKFFGL